MAPCLHVRAGRGRQSLLPARDVETGGARLFRFLPAKGQGKDVMPLQLMEMRLFVKVKGQEVVKALSSLPLPPSPSPRTPTTKPGGALYGLDFAGRDAL